LALIILAHDTLPSLMVSTSDAQITILHNDGTGIFLQEQSVFGDPGTRLSGAIAGDFNGDHLQDIAAVSIDPDGHTRHVVIMVQNPDGTFAPPVTIFTIDSQLQFMQTVDFNGDHRDDLVVSFFGGPDNRAGAVALTNLGAGTFRSTVLLADPLYTVAGKKATAIHPPGKSPGVRGIVVPLSPNAGAGDPVFAFFPAQGDSWGAPIYFDDPAGTGPQVAATGDFNGDGRPDFVGIDNNNALLVFLNNTPRN
jgi:hypothetical protein